MHLVTPSTRYKKSYLQAIEESKNETGVTVIRKTNKGQSFEEFVRHTNGQAKGLHLPDGYVPSTEFWLVDNDEFIGWVNIRHTLTEFLHKIGGHIGYWICPAKRNMGYGNKILKLALIETKKIGIHRALITCDDTNIKSRKIIETNGGVLENIVENGINQPLKRRYWITIK